jgi:hypothetical protein
MNKLVRNNLYYALCGDPGDYVVKFRGERI